MRFPEPEQNEFLTCAIKDAVAVVMLEQGAFEIATDMKVRDQFFALLDEIEKMESVKALLIINSSAYPDVDQQRNFLSSLNQGMGTSPENPTRLFSIVAHTRYQILERLIHYRKLVVAAVQGEIATPFFGISLGLSFRLAAKDAVLRFSRDDFDFPPSWPLCFYLPRYMGQGAAAEILLSAKPLRAGMMAELGLVHRLVPADRFEDRCIEETLELCRLPGTYVAGIKRQLAPDPDELANSFKLSLALMEKELNSRRISGGIAPAHCR